jgi:hypothetical protein
MRHNALSHAVVASESAKGADANPDPISNILMLSLAPVYAQRHKFQPCIISRLFTLYGK